MKKYLERSEFAGHILVIVRHSIFDVFKFIFSTERAQNKGSLPQSYFGHTSIKTGHTYE